MIFLTNIPLLGSAASADFPVPNNIRPAIDFWIKVYTQADTNSGFLHDSQDLSIIYRKLNRDRSLINSTRDGIRKDLEVLATGKRSGLTPSQEALLALWGADVSNERLARAVNNVRWQLGQSDRFIEGLRRSGAYRSHIEAVIREKGLPIELAILPHVESSFHPGAYSSAAATGMWQFVRSTAQRFMQVDYVVDERLDPYAATFGAMELLEYNYNALGSWPLALTAYNHGANGIARAVRDVGSLDIGRIIAEYRGPRFGFASRNFYPQFLAAMEVDRRHEEFYGPVNRDPEPDFQQIELDAYVDARLLADSMGIEIDDLERDNPALQPAVWSGSKRIPRGYRVKLDRRRTRGDLVAALNAIPASQLHGDQIPDLSYSVRSGDSLSVIAERYKTSVSELVAINQLRDRHVIRVGQTLLLPQQDGSVPTLLVNAGEPQAMPGDGRYRVRRGDTASIIAERFDVPLDTLLALNNLSSEGLIFPGQELALRAEPGRVLAANTDDSAAMDNSASIAEAMQAVEEAFVDEQEDDAEETGPTLLASLNSNAMAVEETDEEQARELLADLQTDPADYTVRGDRSIEVQAAETLGHYAEWLGIRAWDIRRLNNMVYRDPVIIGKRLKLDFSKVSMEQFEQRRRQFHRDLQSRYFTSWRIRETEEYAIKRRDFLVNLARDRSVPMWLFRQYNPNVDAARIQIGQVVVFPVVEKVGI